MNHPILANEVQYYKEDEKGVHTMCKSIEELCKEFAAEDAIEIREEMALAMLEDGEKDHAKISRYTKVSIDRIDALKAQLAAATH